MLFKDEYEDIIDGQTFFVEVEGVALGNGEYKFNNILFTDGMGDTVEDDHPLFEALQDRLFSREFELEVHSTDFDYYEYDVDNFLKEKVDF